MEILTETKLQINSYMLNNFKNKGTVGYHYIKRILEYLLQQYKNTGYITIDLSNKNAFKSEDANFTATYKDSSVVLGGTDSTATYKDKIP